MTITVNVPENLESVFSAAEKTVSDFFNKKQFHPESGSIEISGDRYIMLRGASVSVEFFQLCRTLFGKDNEVEADLFASNFLYELAHAIGKSDAKKFHQKMNLNDPVAKLSAGPIVFSHTGWAFVELNDESLPSPDNDYFLAYTHPFSFENDAWKESGLSPHAPVCVMSAGYSSGWCEESFGVPLEARELTCCAMGDEKCQFVMAPPDQIENKIIMFLADHPEVDGTNSINRKLDIDSLNEAQIGQKPGFTDLMHQHLFAYARNLEATKKILNYKVGALLESEEKFRSVFEQAAMGIARVAPDGSFLEVNNKLCEIVGYTRDELVLLTFQDITHPDDLEIDLGYVRQMLAGVISTYTLEKRYIRKGGEVVWINLTVSLTRNDDGSPKYFVVTIEEISSRKQVEADLNFQLSHDKLTGLASRGITMSTIDKEIERAQRYKRPLSVLMIDIDHFKRVNDEFGHQRGDEVLHELGKVLMASIRGCDLAGRYGGEEFLIILPELAQKAAALLAERILRNVSAHQIKLGKKTISITVSIGVASLSGENETAEALITFADEAMYAAKKAGRNQVKLSVE